MNKRFYTLLLTLAFLSGPLFAKPDGKKGAAPKQTPMQQWEATPAGKSYKQWQASPAGKKVYAGEALIHKQRKAFTNMEAVVISLTLPPGARLGFGIMVKIKGTDYILAFGPEKSDPDWAWTEKEYGRRIYFKDETVAGMFSLMWCK